MSKIALFDMDNTLCDYSSALKRDLKLVASPGEKIPDNPHDDKSEIYWKKRINIIRKQPDWWYNLNEYEIGFMVYNLAKEIGFEPHILTKGPVSTSTAWTEKVRWCQKHLGMDVPVTITMEKSLVYGRVLVDDFPEYLEGWLFHRPNGVAIMPAYDYNKDYKHSRVIRFDGTNIGEVRKALQFAFDR